MATAPDFPPLIVKTKYQPDGSTRSNFIAAVDDLTKHAKSRFQESFGEIDGIISRTLSRPRTGLNFDLPGLRKTAADADLALQRLTAMRDAAQRLAASTGDTSAETAKYTQALSAQVIEAERAKTIADAQVTTYSRLQAEINGAVSGQDRLAAAYRATYAEQAKLANAAFASQQDLAGRFNLSRTGADTYGFEPPKSARDSAAVFEAMALAEERAAAEAKELAAGVNALRATLDPTIAVQQRFNSAMDLTDRAFEQGVLHASEYQRIQAQLRAEIQQSWSTITRSIDGGAAATVRGTSAQRFAYVQLGQQLQDSVVQAQMGTSAFTILVQQGSQAAFALSGLEGKVGAAARIISGPWGAAIFAGTALLGPFIAKIFETGSAIDDLLSKRQKDAQAARDGAVANEIFSHSLDGAIEKVRTLNGELAKRIQSQEQINRLTLKDAQTQLQRLQTGDPKATNVLDRGGRVEIARQLTEAQGNYTWLKEHPAQGAGAADMQQARLEQAQARITALQARLTQIDKEIENAKVAVRAAEVPIMVANAEAQANGTAAIRTKYQKQIDAITAGHVAGWNQTTEGTAAIAKILQAQEAELKALQESQRAITSGARELAPFGSPLAGNYRVSSGFGAREKPTAGASTDHRAIDYAAPLGTPVLAAMDGIVKFANVVAGYGNEIALSHGAGTETRYAHLRDFAVREGEAVSKGQTIGYVGQTGVATGPHLHYEVLVNGKKVDPNGGKFPVDPTQVAQAAEASGRVLDNFGRNASERISRITEAFDEQPRAIDRAAQATRELQTLYDQLKAKGLLDPDTEKRIADARAAVTDSLSRPFRNMLQEQERGLEIQQLTSAGRDRDAEALQLQFRLMDMLGVKERENLATELAKYGVSQQQYGQMLRNIEAARQLDREQQRFNERQQAQLEQISSLRSNVTQTILDTRSQGLGAFGGFFSRLQDQFDNFTANDLVDRLFGDAFQSMEDVVRNAKQVEADASNNAARQLLNLGDAAAAAAANLTGSVGSALGAANDNQSAALRAQLNEIVVSGRDYANPRTLFSMMGTKLADTLFDEKTAKRLGKGIGEALEGASYGRLGGGIAFGSNSSPLGSSIGGMLGEKLGEKVLGKALGSFAGPLGGIAGGIVGSLVGSLFRKTPYGSAAISNGNVTISGNNSGAKSGASSEADKVNSALNSIVDRLGGTLGNYAVSIGITNGNYNVNPGLVTGKIGTTKQRDTIDFKKDEAAALSWAIQNAIQDGAIQGVRAGTQAILKAAKDIDKGVQDALDFESIFARLKAYTDPVGAALDTLDKEFARYKQLAITAGEGMVETEALYAKERQKVIEQAAEQTVGSLKNLYSQLTVGDSGLSLRDRLANAQAGYDPLRARVAAGDVSAFDDYSTAAQTLLDVSRQLYGSQGAYFSVREEILGLTKSTIDKQSDIAAIAANRDSPFSTSTVASNDNAAVVTALDQLGTRLLDGLGTQLAALNQNMGTLIDQGAANGTTGLSFNYPGTW